MAEERSVFHEGEKAIQSRLGIRDRMEKAGRASIRDHIAEPQQAFLQHLPLFVVGTLDATGRPWASVLTGQPGFVQARDAGTLSVRGRPAYGDIFEKTLAAGADIGGLGIDLETRRRVRVNGRVAAVDEHGFGIDIAQSFANCPQYVQARSIEWVDEANDRDGQPRVSCGPTLNKAQAAFVAAADTFFIASRAAGDEEDASQGLDVSHRGGLPGFVIVAHETSLLFPDYSGNCFFNTLGNLTVDPRCGLTFVDFESGDLLQLSGEAEILWHPHHTERFPGAQRVIAFRVEEARSVENAMKLRTSFQGYAPELEALREPEVPPQDPITAGSMTLLSVNLSAPREVAHEGKMVQTGIFKQPAEGRVMLRRLNLDGDGQADLWGHGGAFRAVYVYSAENYSFWRQELGRDDLPVGTFGENFTVEGMPDDTICVGDVFRIGEALVEVSQPRIPCFKLALKMGIPNFQNRFLEQRRVGFYFRVLEEGEVGAGDPIKLVRRDPKGMTVRQVNDLLFFDKDDLEATRQALSIPALSHGWKGSFEERLAKAETDAGAQRGFRDFVVDRKEPESETITSFYLLPSDGKPLASFQPGQFLTFQLTIPGQSKPLMRTYSLSDSPDCDYYRVSIKREPPPSGQPKLPPGLSSSYFHDQVDVGANLSVGPPRGKFVLDRDSDRSLVLLSAGVGLTPMISMANAVVRAGSSRPVWFIHGARNGREHAMGAHLRGLAERHPNVRPVTCYSRPDTTDIAGRDYDRHGRVDVELLKSVLPFDDHEFYLCGPAPFMRSLYCDLAAMGVPASRIHYEFFGPGSLLAEEAEPTGRAPTRGGDEEVSGAIPVMFARSGVTAQWSESSGTLLELAEEQGLQPPYSCRSGICQTCICDVVDGDFEYVEEPLARPGDSQVLICCARPKSNLTIDV